MGHIVILISRIQFASAHNELLWIEETEGVVELKMLIKIFPPAFYSILINLTLGWNC